MAKPRSGMVKSNLFIDPKVQKGMQFLAKKRGTTYSALVREAMRAFLVEALLEGKRGVMVGIVNKAFAYTPFEKSIKHHLTIDPVLLEIAGILSI